MSVSLMLHLICAIAVAAFVMPHENLDTSASRPSNDSPVVVWLPNSASLGGSGGGGGNRVSTSSRTMSRPGREARSVPAESTPSPENDRGHAEPVALAAQPLSAGAELHAGVVETSPELTDARGSGDDGGADRGLGRGVGSGLGDGVGPGRDRGSGGDAYTPGNGVSAPTVLRHVRPSYTVEAMRARAAGTVILVCVVDVDGVCKNIRIVRSADPVYGLDREAIAAAREWRFAPGRRAGVPVPVIVRLELGFSMR